MTHFDENTPRSAETDAGRQAGIREVIDALKTFLPEWNYPDYVVAAICLEIKRRLHLTEGFAAYASDATDWANATLQAGAEAWGLTPPDECPSVAECKLPPCGAPEVCFLAQEDEE